MPDADKARRNDERDKRSHDKPARTTPSTPVPDAAGLLGKRQLDLGPNEGTRISVARQLQRSAGNRAVQRLVDGPHGTNDGKDGDVAQELRAPSGDGRPLDGGVRQRLESGLGAPLTDVRVHSGPASARLARDVGAVAFTSGSDVYLGEGAPSGSAERFGLLAHEATHVVQQRRGPVAGRASPQGLSISDPHDPFEQEADRVTAALVSGTRHSAASAETSSVASMEAGEVVQRQATAPADVNVGFNPMDIAHRLVEAIDQSEVQARMGQDPRSWTRHIDFPKVASVLAHLTADQVKQVEREYYVYEKRGSLREDIFGGGESHFRSDLSRDQLDQIEAMLGGTRAAGPEGAADAMANQLNADAARLHELLYGDLKEKDVEEVMALLRRSSQGNQDLAAAYDRLHVYTLVASLQRLPMVELPRATMLMAGNIVAADRYKVSMELSRIEAIGSRITELTKPKETTLTISLVLGANSFEKIQKDMEVDNLKKERKRLVESLTRRGEQAVVEGRREAGGEDPTAVAMAGEARASAVLGGVDRAATIVGGREGAILRAVAFSDPAARAAAELRKLKDSDDLKAKSIAATLRGLRDEAEAEARRRNPDAMAEVIQGEAAVLADQYLGRLRAVWDAGVTGDGPRFDDLLKATGNETEREINRQLMAGRGRMDEVSELVLALTGGRKDMEAVKRVLQDKNFGELQDLKARYKDATQGRDLDYDLFGEGATHADEQEKNLWTSGMIPASARKFGGKATGSDRLLLEDYLQRPKHEGSAEEVLYLSARAEREYQYTIDNRGATGWWRDNWGNEARSLLDRTIETVRALRGEYLTKAGFVPVMFGPDRITNQEWTESGDAHEILHQMRLARATIRGDRAGYEKATAALRAMFEMVAAFVIQAALTAVIGPVAEFIFALEALEAAEAAATTIRLAKWARDTGVAISSTVGANAMVYGEDYSWDRFKHDVVGGLAGAVGQTAAEKLVGPVAKGFAGRLGDKAPAEIAKVAGTYGNITFSSIAMGETPDVGLTNVVRTHMMAKGGEYITKSLREGMGLPPPQPRAAGGPPEGGGEQAMPGATEEAGGPSVREGAAAGEPTVPMALPDEPAAGGSRIVEPREARPPARLPEPAEAAPKVPEKAAPKPEAAPSGEPAPTPAGQGEKRSWTTPDLSNTYTDLKFPRHNVLIEKGLPGFDMRAVMRELEATAWGSRIADRIRSGEVKLRVLKELPPGYSGAAVGDEIFIEWHGSVTETASYIVHEGSHNLDPALATYGHPESASKLSMEAEARAFEFEYRKEHHEYSGDPVEKAYFKAWDETYWATRDEVQANIAAEKAMLEALQQNPEHYAVEAPQEQAGAMERAVERVGQLLEEMAGGKLWGDEIARPEDLPTNPGTSPFAHERTTPQATNPLAEEHTASIEPAFVERMQIEERLESARYARARAAAEHRIAYEAYQRALAEPTADLRGVSLMREEALARFAAADREVKALTKRRDELSQKEPAPAGP